MPGACGPGWRLTYNRGPRNSPRFPLPAVPVLSLENACLAFGHVALLDHAALQVDAGERIGLIGRNGSGKSSLLKALAGLGSLDDGTIWRQPELSIAYVAQEPEFAGHETVYEAVASGLGDIARLLADYHDATLKVGTGGTAALEHLQHLQTQLEASDGWRLNSRVEQAISRWRWMARRASMPSRAAAASALPWRGRWSASRSCCCSTSRPTTSMSTASCGWRTCCDPMAVPSS
jgi:hypothetical protein